MSSRVTLREQLGMLKTSSFVRRLGRSIVRNPLKSVAAAGLGSSAGLVGASLVTRRGWDDDWAEEDQEDRRMGGQEWADNPPVSAYDRNPSLRNSHALGIGATAAGGLGALSLGAAAIADFEAESERRTRRPPLGPSRRDGFYHIRRFHPRGPEQGTVSKLAPRSAYNFDWHKATAYAAKRAARGRRGPISFM